MTDKIRQAAAECAADYYNERALAQHPPYEKRKSLEEIIERAMRKLVDAQLAPPKDSEREDALIKLAILMGIGYEFNSQTSSSSLPPRPTPADVKKRYEERR